MRDGKKQAVKSKFSQMVRVLTAAVLTGLFTLSCADPWKENVPDFEVCFMEELPGTNAHAGNRNYLMWWTLLGVLPAEKDSFVPEKEATLTGREMRRRGGVTVTLFSRKKKILPCLRGIYIFHSCSANTLPTGKEAVFTDVFL